MAAELPFMASEEILMAAVRAGGDRQELHEVLRRHSQAAAEQVKLHGNENDLISRISQDPHFSKIKLKDVLEPSRFIGRCPEQVDRFVASVVGLIRQRYSQVLGKNEDIEV